LIFSTFTPFNPFRDRILKNPFLAVAYITKQGYCPNFILIASAVWARRLKEMQLFLFGFLIF